MKFVSPKNRRRGSVLIIAMLIMFAVTALVITLNRQAYTQAQASANDYASQQADAIERGAEQYAIGLLAQYRDTLSQEPESNFAAVPVGSGYFWFVRPNYNDVTLPSYGLLDESSKVNLNTVSANALLAINGVSPEIAGAIVDWRDTDENLSQSGAETSTYSSLPEPYAAKNAPFESVEEMLLLNGMTRQIMYGDPATSSTAPGDYYLAHGIADYFTCWSTQGLTAADGTTRVSVSTASQRPAVQQILIQVLGDTRGRAAYQAAYGGRNPPPVVDVFDFANRARLTTAEFASLEDYITSRAATTTTTGTGTGTGASTGTGTATDATDTTATSTTTGPKGQININIAPREVLMTLTTARNSLIGQADIDTLISTRAAAVANNPKSIAWVYEALKEKSVGLGRYVCGQGNQYSADIVAASGNGRGFRHVRVVIDVSTAQPRIVFRHDISDHGWPLDPQVLTSLRAGQTPTPGTSTTSGGTH